MKILSRLLVVFAFVALTFGNFQTVWAAPDYPKPDLKPIKIGIPIQRGDDEKFNKAPQPGFDVTLLLNQTAHFTWDDKTTGKFIIKDDTGKIIFDAAVGSKNSLDITPGDLNLKSGQKYSWSVDGKKFYKFTILDAESEKAILDNLAEIDAAENLSEEVRTINKAIYLQQLSKLYPDTLDLYWLSAQWLSEISSTDENIANEKNRLLKKCVQHHLMEERRQA